QPLVKSALQPTVKVTPRKRLMYEYVYTLVWLRSAPIRDATTSAGGGKSVCAVKSVCPLMSKLPTPLVRLTYCERNMCWTSLPQELTGFFETKDLRPSTPTTWGSFASKFAS